MNATRLLYRTRQFWQALKPSSTLVDLKLVQAVLTAPQMALFNRLQPSEQAHSLRVLQALLDQGERNPDLLQAALLHDVGKTRFPLRIWERVLIVIGNILFPERVAGWGAGPPTGWRRPFVVAARHPAWGAELAAAAGASPLAVELIRKHQDRLPAAGDPYSSLEARLLRTLQAVDDES